MGRTIATIVALIGWSAVSAAAMMQPSDRDTTRSHRLHEVEVTSSQARRTTTSSAPLYALDRHQMQRMGISNIADALHRLPGITLRDYGGAGGMKTVSVRGFGAQHTGVSYDGVMISDYQSGEIDVSRYSIDNVNHLQLTIGDNNDIFQPARQAASPAVLAIETLREPTADRRPHLTTQLKAGSFGYVSPFLKYEQRFSPQLFLSASGEYVYAENDYPYTIRNVTQTIHERRTNSRMNQGHGELNLRWQPDLRHKLLLKAYYYDNDRQLPGQVRYYTNASGESLRERDAFAQASYALRPATNWAVKVFGKFNWSSSSYRDTLYPNGFRDADYWQREGYAAACVLYAPDTHWAFDYSADYTFNNLNSSLKTDTRPYRHTILQSLTGKFSLQRLTMTGRLLHSLYLNNAQYGPGARNMRRLSPSFSLNYQPIHGQQLFVRASYKNIFRSPTFNESYFFHYGSTNLAPESTNQLNVGITYASTVKTLADHATELRFTFDAYRNDVTDKIVAVPYNMFVWTCINVGKVVVRGFDTTLSIDRHFGKRHALLFTANYSYQRAEDRTSDKAPYYGNQIAYMPEHTGAASIDWSNPWLCLSLNAHAMSHRWTTNEHFEDTRVDGYSDWGFTAYRDFTLGTHTLEARLDLKNLLDKHYEIVSHYPMPGRSYQFSLLYKF